MWFGKTASEISSQALDIKREKASVVLLSRIYDVETAKSTDV